MECSWYGIRNDPICIPHDIRFVPRAWKLNVSVLFNIFCDKEIGLLTWVQHCYIWQLVGNNSVMTPIDMSQRYGIHFPLVFQPLFLLFCNCESSAFTENGCTCTDTLWEESTSHWWIHFTNADLRFFFDVSLNKLLNKPLIGQWFATPWRSCDIALMSHRCRSWLDRKCQDYVYIKWDYWSTM